MSVMRVRGEFGIKPQSAFETALGNAAARHIDRVWPGQGMVMSFSRIRAGWGVHHEYSLALAAPE
jgi:hypothetical protein